MANDRIRVLVVDDTALYRTIIRDVLKEHPTIEVVGTAANGKIALDKVAELQPDVLTLDVEMPEMDGIEVLRKLKGLHRPVDAIMLSAFTSHGAKSTVAALELGALDFVLKPSGGSRDENIDELRKSLCSKIEALGNTLHIRRLLRGNSRPAPPSHAPKDRRDTDVMERMRQLTSTFASQPRIVAIGISTGGPEALNPGGYLFVGASESLASVDPRFVPQHHCRSVFYQPGRQTALV